MNCKELKMNSLYLNMNGIKIGSELLLVLSLLSSTNFFEKRYARN